ncbi:MAG: phage major capsid protein [Dehalococcoidia bacterium]|nr:phage major capsid protein [Dehalococcoidia bacterium]
MLAERAAITRRASHPRGIRLNASKDPRVREIWTRMESIIEAGQADRRDLTPAEITEYRSLDVQLGHAVASAEFAGEVRHDPRVTDPERVSGGYALRRASEAGYLNRDESLRERIDRRGLITDEERELSFGKMLRGIITGEWRDAEAENRALSHGSAGIVLPLSISAGIIDRFRTQATVLRAGARTYEMTAAKHHLPKLTGGITAAWHFDNSTIADSDPSFGAVELEAKTLTALCKAPLSLVEDAPALGEAVERELAAAIATEVDRAALYGTGASGEPLGVVNTSGVESVAGGGALSSFDKVADIFAAIADNNAPVPADVILSNRTRFALGKLKTGITNDNSPLPLPDFMSGVTFHPTSQVLTTEGGGSDARVFVGGFEELVVGIRHQLTIQILQERFISEGQIGFLAFWRGDIAILRPGAIGMITGVTS